MDNRHAVAHAAYTINPLRMLAGGLLLAVGALFTSIGHAATGLARHCISEAALRDLARALRSFRNTSRSTSTGVGERRLQSIGPVLLSTIFGAFCMLWILLLLGGSLFWLVTHGWGLLVLICTLAIGSAIGLQRAQIKQHMPSDELLN